MELILPQWLQPLGAEYQARNHVYRVLQPSATLAEAWMRRQGQGAWIAKVLPMVREHHKLSPYRNGARFEAFRRAGWLDVSLGLLHPVCLQIMSSRSVPLSSLPGFTADWCNWGRGACGRAREPVADVEALDELIFLIY